MAQSWAKYNHLAFFANLSIFLLSIFILIIITFFDKPTHSSKRERVMEKETYMWITVT